MNTSSDTLGRRLKMERERRGISLETIAASTKINGSLLAGLERDDVSKWPQGIFGRAFVREYAASIGLAPEPIVAEFVRLLAEQQPGEVQHDTVPESDGLRLTLADGGREPLAAIATRVATAALEACVVVGAAQALAWSAGLNFWTVCGTASLSYYGLAAACWERTPASRWLQGDRPRPAGSDASAQTRPRDLLGLLVQRSDGPEAATENLQSAAGIILPS